MKAILSSQLGLIVVGLFMVSTVVNCDEGGETSAATGGVGNTGVPQTGAGGNPASMSGINLSACLDCGKTACTTASSSCSNTAGCSDLLSCSINCTSGDSACQNQCVTVAANNSAAILAAADYVACLSVQCVSTCVPKVTGVGGATSVATTATPKGCYGAPRASCPILSSSECKIATGCTPTLVGKCAGTTPDSSTLYDAASCRTYGYTWDSLTNYCYGTRVDCASNTTQYACQQRSWCSWDLWDQCSGSITPCVQLTAATCTNTPGCRWGG